MGEVISKCSDPRNEDLDIESGAVVDKPNPDSGPGHVGSANPFDEVSIEQRLMKESPKPFLVEASRRRQIQSSFLTLSQLAERMASVRPLLLIVARDPQRNMINLAARDLCERFFGWTRGLTETSPKTKPNQSEYIAMHGPHDSMRTCPLVRGVWFCVVWFWGVALTPRRLEVSSDRADFSGADSDKR